MKGDIKMRFEECVAELITIFDEEMEVINNEFDVENFSGFSDETNDLIDKIIVYAQSLSEGTLKIEDIIREGL